MEYKHQLTFTVHSITISPFYIQPVLPPPPSLNTMIQCVTSRLIDTTLLRERLSLVIKWKKTGRTITFDQRFEYREDPIIENVEPSSGIVRYVPRL